MIQPNAPRSSTSVDAEMPNRTMEDVSGEHDCRNQRNMCGNGRELVRHDSSSPLNQLMQGNQTIEPSLSTSSDARNSLTSQVFNELNDAVIANGYPLNRQIPSAGALRMRAHRARKRQRIEQSRANSSADQENRVENIDLNIDNYEKPWDEYFRKKFTENRFGRVCDVCDRIWFKEDLKKVKAEYLSILEPIFGSESQSYKLCSTCFASLKKNRLPQMSISNGFRYPVRPVGLPELNAISKRLISPRIPFMTIRRLQRSGYAIVGQVINIPVDVNSMIKKLPRALNDDQVINVSIRRKIFHTSAFVQGQIKKSDLKVWLEYLVNSSLYRKHDIKIDWEAFNQSSSEPEGSRGNEDDLIEDIGENTDDSVELMSRQETLLWDEAKSLDLAPGDGNRPLNFMFDEDAEELSFPEIYFGQPRTHKVKVTSYQIASSEIRRRDRRGAAPGKILYVAAKILRQRVVDGIQHCFRRVSETEGITRSMIEDRNFLDQCVEKNLSFLKSLPNSSQYWQSKKLDLFAMMRQLGKPTIFMTLSANEMKWAPLISILYELRGNSPEIEDPITNLTKSQRGNLVNEDPVTCCLYFNKLVEVIRRMIGAKGNINPFGKYRVVDYFMRIEFQHRGSPHAHILLWLDNDPKETVSENMPETIKMIDYLCSVSRTSISSEFYCNQIHRHTFTCTKRGESSCRFNYPIWPMNETRILQPLTKDDSRKQEFKATAKLIRKNLEEKNYSSFSAFMDDNNLEYRYYLNIIRSTLKKPTFLLRRTVAETMTNSFNPNIAKILNSNMDIQVIADEYSCAAYVVDYVNKSSRGTSNLHREVAKLIEQNPELTQTQLYKRIGNKVLNSVEMSAQEAAWFLLRLPMSHCSRKVVYIPTVHPSERQKCHKSKDQLKNLDPDSTDIWTQNIIQRYEMRPVKLDSLCLADFAALHTKERRKSTEEQDDQDDSYRERQFKRIIRFRNYDISDVDNYKREMVTLYLPFRNEWAEILDRNKFIELYANNLSKISSKRDEYEVMKIDQIVEELMRAQNSASEVLPNHTVDNPQAREESSIFTPYDPTNNTNVIATVRTRKNVMPKEEYVRLMRSTNHKQRELILEFIHRITLENSHPIQIFFTGPAGCGKTYVLRLLMETINRFSRETNDHNNSYVACASTGKAAVNLGGTTVHSAFSIAQSSTVNSMSAEAKHRLQQKFDGTICIIIDEVSMIGNKMLHSVHNRLRAITTNMDDPFGGISMVFCGDFRQLPPVQQQPVYQALRSDLRSNALWQSLDYFQLDQVMRQSDLVFSTILTKIGNGQSLSDGESQLIESRFRPESWCDATLIGVIRLYHQNSKVNSYNAKVLTGGMEHISKDHITGHSNESELSLARTRLHRLASMETGGLPYCVTIKEGYPYMITNNVRIEDGLVNGAIGILKHYEIQELCDPDGKENSITLRVWLDFQDHKMGALTRSECSSRPDLTRQGWTPITEKSTSINLGGSIRCKRIQVPLNPACAITIHKSQGGTFDKAVISYDKSQSNNLVYVALSRVKSIDGLYIINARNDFVFYHKTQSNRPSVKEVRDEYLRLSNHKLRTLRDEAEKFIKKSSEGINNVIICTINAQSLVAHAEDIESDEILSKSDVLVITETWMNDDVIQIENFEFVGGSRNFRAGRSDIGRRVAGGVAFYKNKEAKDLDIMVEDFQRARRGFPADSLTAIVNIDSQKFVMIGIYIHPKSSKTSIKSLVTECLSKYTTVEKELALIITGDFNFNIEKDKWIVELMKDEFGLDLVPCESPTTIYNTTIDLSFARRMCAEGFCYISYFSDHRPVFNKIRLNGSRPQLLSGTATPNSNPS